MGERYKPSKQDVIRIEMIDPPQHKLKGEGVYQWRFQSEKVMMDIITLEKELKLRVPARSDFIIDRLQNFRKVFINLSTGEIST